MASATNNLKVRIVVDSCPENPRKWDNLGTMVCAHRRYSLGDDNGLDNAKAFVRQHLSDELCTRNGWDLDHVPDLERAIEHTGQAVLLPLYLYDHSGLTMKTTSFSCPWDSGQVGFIFVSKATLRQEYGYTRLSSKRVSHVVDALKGEVEVYDQYISNDVWGFEVIGDNGDEVDSCWGFFGDDPMTNGMIDYLSAAAKDLVMSGQYQRCY
jgi:hypothetical protein